MSETETIVDAEIPSADPSAVLIQYNGLVHSVMNRYSNLVSMIPAVDADDLEQAAKIGLLMAKSTYNPQQGKSFCGWATWYIQKEIRRAIGFKGDCSPEITSSLDEPLSDDDPDATKGDMIPDTGDSVEDIVEQSDRAEAVHEAVDRLPANQSEVISMAYFERMTVDEIGTVMDLTDKEVKSTKQTALDRMQRDKTLRKRIFIDPYNIHVGIKAFNSTWISAVEKAVFLLEECGY